jgi:hypothetical protein
VKNALGRLSYGALSYVMNNESESQLWEGEPSPEERERINEIVDAGLCAPRSPDDLKSLAKKDHKPPNSCAFGLDCDFSSYDDLRQLVIQGVIRSYAAREY